ncbi:hypothetical protein [Streptomyces sp. NPDC058751]|uniref:hypothetical protein n=1 Tax=Streptomyces sp. NPDC058751 TaxID=3346623 RepID=UPI0036B16F52
MVEGAGPYGPYGMLEWAHGADAVELEYRPTAEDFTSAVRALMRVGRESRKWFWWFVYFVVASFVSAAISWSEGHMTSVAIRLGGLPVFLCIAWSVPVSWARRLQREAEPHGTSRVTVTNTGVIVTTDRSTKVREWAAQPRYRETRGVFVVLGPDKSIDGMTLLPKRAVRTPEDVDRLRAILDRNLTRV